MADKNLHDIKIDDLDNPKKTPLKNILTLLALLFIILVISVAITRLILNTDEDGLSETNGSVNSAIVETEGEKNSDSTVATTAGLAAAAVAGSMLANGTALTERNVSTATKSSSSTESKKDDASDKKQESRSKIKATLREHRPVKAKEVTHPKKHTVIPKKPKHVVKKAPSHNNSSSTKQYVDKVVSSSNKPSATHSHLGEKRAGYYIKVGTFKDTSTAVSKIKKTGLDYILIKPKNAKTTTRVLIGPFKSNWGAKQHLPSVKNNIAEGAYITRID
ncbi:membrane protein [hydrothermal vent metagenome]|uniref:Membrane protein n=1 Tax=hydrothermal vent metagenome TaxID=652676 RepID=A0A1W1CJH8_9ZZZZ